VLFGGARGGGKTDSLLGRAITRSLRHPGLYRGLLLRRTYDELDEVNGRAHELLDPIGARWRAARHMWEFPWGGWLKMRYLQRDSDASRYQGHSYNDLLIDEAGNFPDPAPIDKLVATLRDKNGVPCRQAMSANPGGPGHAWLVQRYIEPAKPGVPFFDPLTGAHRVYLPSLVTDNPALLLKDPKYLQRLRRSGPSWLIRAWILGDWNAYPDGNVIRIEWFGRYSGEPDGVVGIVQSWDTGIKPEQVNDPSVCTTWAVTRHGAYLLDVFRERLKYPDLKRKAIELAELWQPSHVLIEDKGSGQSLIQDLRDSTMVPCIPIEPIGDKVSRMIGATGPIEAGKVFLPRVAPWLQAYEGELSIFPLAPHDDQVDSTSQFINWMRTSLLGQLFDFDSTGSRVGAMLGTDPTDDLAPGYGSMHTDGDDYSGYNP
jgi:predicted phage terminase large subunit-like protein